MRKVIARKKYESKPYPKKDLLDGSIVVINKPKGPFSYHITDSVKKALRANKTGHAGTLDPNATGVLPVGINKGCHLLQAISQAPKEYEGVMHLHATVTMSQLIQGSKNFIGKITQLPPVRSAVKRAEREREIYSLKINEVKGRDVYFTVLCQAGTYVRKLCTDWGQSMGINANLKDLVRTRAGPYTLKDAVEFDEFLKEPKSYLKPLETAVTHLGHVWLDDNTVESISHGSQPFLPGVFKYESGIKKGDLIALMNSADELVAIAWSLMNSKSMSGSKGQLAKLERVLL